MNREDYGELVGTIHTTRTVLSRGKSEDYATEDVLSNFKRMNLMMKTLDIDPRRSPADCALFLALLKFDRWTNLRKKGAAPKNESVSDTVMDFHNYLDLAYACDIDENL